jgi:hypothetical protein
MDEKEKVTYDEGIVMSSCAHAGFITHTNGEFMNVIREDVIC